MRWPWSPTPADPLRSRTGAASRPRAADTRAAAEPGSPSRVATPRLADPRAPSSPTPDLRPVWLLDVDGVLNANRPGWGGPPAEGYAHAGDRRFWIRWSPELVRRLIAMHGTGAVEIRWATTWVPWIDAIEELLGLPDWPAAWEGPYEGAGTPAIPTPLRKIQTALRVVEQERRPLIWTDDDAIPTHGPAHDRIADAAVPSLLVRPASREGLQPSDLEAIAEFLQRNGPPQSDAVAT